MEASEPQRNGGIYLSLSAYGEGRGCEGDGRELRWSYASCGAVERDVVVVVNVELRSLCRWCLWPMGSGQVDSWPRLLTRALLRSVSCVFVCCVGCGYVCPCVVCR